MGSATECVRCGKDGPHYVPPSLGEPGFFTCDSTPAASSRTQAESGRSQGSGTPTAAGRPAPSAKLRLAVQMNLWRAGARQVRVN